MADKTFDVTAMGRSGMDLYANDVGADFVDITSFAAYVGGSPTNIAVGTRRLGLNVALLTAVGDDPPGDFLLKFFEEEGIVTDYIPRKPGYRTSAVVLGIEPPDKFPLVYYRHNCADMAFDIDDVLAAPLTDTRVLEVSGTGLSREPNRSATYLAAEIAKQARAAVVLDIDFRPDQWHDVRAFGVSLRALLPLVDIVLGTEEEINAAMLKDPTQVRVEHSQISGAEVAGDLDANIQAMLGYGLEALVVKRGAKGASIIPAGEPMIDVPGFPVEVYNVLGAGDAFASGFVYGYVKGWDFYKACRMGNACGAIVVTRHGCANFMGYEDEVLKFIEEKGGF